MVRLRRGIGAVALAFAVISIPHGTIKTDKRGVGGYTGRLFQFHMVRLRQVI